MLNYGSKYLDRLVVPLIIGDLLIIAAAWYTGFAIRYFLPDISHLSSLAKGQFFSQYMLAGLVIIPIFFIISSQVGIYSSLKLTSIVEQTYKIAVILILTNAIWFTILFFRQIFIFSRLHNLLFTLIAFLSLIAFRYILILKNRRPSKIKEAVVVGDPAIAEQLFLKFKKRPELGVNIFGFIGDKNQQKGNKVNLLGKLKDLDSILAEQKIDEIYVVLGANSEVTFALIDTLLKYQQLDVNIIIDQHSSFINPQINNFENLIILTARQYPMSGYNVLIKRLSDIVFASLLILIFSPIWLVIIIAIKLTSFGPIFYRQSRVSLDGDLFKIIKFRSMIVDAEAKTGAKWATSDDKRTTKIGKFLRSSSLDETPQFINVLKGEMSLVGPRPERPEFIEQFSKEIPYYMARHRIKTGITGWAQVNGWRGNTSLSKRIEHDLFYITHWSLFFDLKIIFLTIYKGFINKNAY